MRKTLIDLTSQKFGKLTVVERVPSKSRNARWKCLCECGGEKEVQGAHLRSGSIASCGCEKRARMTKHGYTRSSEYQTWRNIRARCRNPKTINYLYYGGRGIKVVDRWNSFENFLEDMGLKPSPKHTIERINNDGDYEPSNCRWALMSEQSTNKRPFKSVKGN